MTGPSRFPPCPRDSEREFFPCPYGPLGKRAPPSRPRPAFPVFPSCGRIPLGKSSGSSSWWMWRFPKPDPSGSTSRYRETSCPGWMPIPGAPASPAAPSSPRPRPGTWPPRREMQARDSFLVPTVLLYGPAPKETHRVDFRQRVDAERRAAGPSR